MARFRHAPLSPPVVSTPRPRSDPDRRSLCGRDRREQARDPVRRAIPVEEPAVNAKRIGVIAGAFNPVTRAHVALAEAARAHVDEMVFAVPRAFPHKEYSGASLDHRVEMLRRACERSLCEARVEIVDGGLFADIASEVRRSRPGSEI